jgi:peptidoglycan-N-acetylglucosamine deacetylase
MTRIFILLATCALLYSCNEKADFIDFSYPDGKHKALVLSYDDGTIQDIELASLFDQHHLVGTFNLNSAYLGTKRGWAQENGNTVFQDYVPKDSLLFIYEHHEIAAHGAFHRDFINISSEEILEEINTDIENLTELTERKIISMAYPFGNTNEDIANVVSTTGIINARTVGDTYKYGLPKNYLMWHPTCHDSKVLDYLDEYLMLDDSTLSLFYVWGHSWEFADKDRWNNMLVFCEKMGKADDIWSVGNGELTQYLKAIKRVEVKENQIINPADNELVWIRLSTGIEKLEAGKTRDIQSVEIN